MLKAGPTFSFAYAVAELGKIVIDKVNNKRRVMLSITSVVSYVRIGIFAPGIWYKQGICLDSNW